MKSFISCGFINWKKLLPLGAVFFYIIRYHCFNKIEDETMVLSDKISFINPIWIKTLGIFLGEILWSILICTPFNPKQSFESYDSNKTVLLIETEGDEYIIKRSFDLKTYSLILMCAFLNILYSTVIIVLDSHYESINGAFENDLRLIQVFFIIPFSKLILKFLQYNHHYFGHILIFIGLIALLVKIFILGTDITLKCIAIILNIICPLQIVLEKYIMDKKYIHPFYIVLYEGLIGTFLCLWIIFFWYFTELNEIIFRGYYYGLGVTIEQLRSFVSTVEGVLYITVHLISNSGFSFFMRFTIFYFSPMYCSLVNSFSSWSFFVMNIIKTQMSDLEQNWTEFTFNLIGYSCIIWGNWVYNELIVLNFWDLEKNTKYEITQRAVDEEIKISFVWQKDFDCETNGDGEEQETKE